MNAGYGSIKEVGKEQKWFCDQKKQETKPFIITTSVPNARSNMTPYEKYIRHTVLMLENIVEYYRNANGVTKKKILCCIFDEILVLENERVAATPFSPAVQVLLNITNRFQRAEKKKAPF